ncbi:MAG TPA: ATP-binding cassette domain-containing protein [Puia sp.]|nr:ATP-binding cassette domain-containing protein [Puia sp.]
MTEKMIDLEGLSVSLGGVCILGNIDLSIHRGEQWLITGPSGSGKTVLAHTLMGRHYHTGVMRLGTKCADAVKATGTDDRRGHEVPLRISIVEQQHRFRNLPGATELYYQQRFNSSDAELTITVEQELREYAFMEKADAGEWVEGLHIGHLLSKPLIQLSNGENKRVQLAIALSAGPDLLILDNPFIGLDLEGRETLHRLIDLLSARGIQILLVSSAREIPDAITHVARLEKGRIVLAGAKQAFHLMDTEAAAEGRVRLDTAILDQLRHPVAEFAVAVKMVDVVIRYGETIILNDINWEVRKGERWNVSGPNGAGKSTLLSLITADNPQAYANQIWLFDRRRGSGESIWDIKQKIGFVSPELHLYFDYGATCHEVIASGLFDTIGLFRTLSPGQETSVLLWMRLLSLGEVRDKRLAQLSTGQQRMVLLARALIKNPPMLILDEPCQGLDEDQTLYFKELISELCEAFATTLIYVSHYSQEIPGTVNRFLKLTNGSMVNA